MGITVRKVLWFGGQYLFWSVAYWLLSGREFWRGLAVVSLVLSVVFSFAFRKSATFGRVGRFGALYIILAVAWYSVGGNVGFGPYYIGTHMGLPDYAYCVTILPALTIAGAVAVSTAVGMLLGLLPTPVTVGLFYLGIILLLYGDYDLAKYPLLAPGYTTFEPGELNKNLSDHELNLVDSFL